MANANYQLLSKFARTELCEMGLQELDAGLMQVVDWGNFFLLAQAHSMVPLVAHHIFEHSLHLPKLQRRSLAAMAIEHKAFGKARYTAMQEVIECFEAQSLEFVVLKGLALAQMLYAQDSWRPMRDVDLLLTDDDCYKAADVLRSLGYDLPRQQQNRWEDGIQHLPNAQKKVDGFDISIELHHNAIHRDSRGSLKFLELDPNFQEVRWKELNFNTLCHFDMLNQLCRHIQGPDGERLIKIISMLDIALYAEKYIAQIPWGKLRSIEPHTLNSLRCINIIIPLSEQLKKVVEEVDEVELTGVGEPMGSFRYVVGRQDWSLYKKLHALFVPSRWWLHLYYGALPQNNIRIIRWFLHPLNVLCLVIKRAMTTLKSFWSR